MPKMKKRPSSEKGRARKARFIIRSKITGKDYDTTEYLSHSIASRFAVCFNQRHKTGEWEAIVDP